MCCGKSKVSNSNWLKFLHSQVGDKAVGMTSLLYSYKNNQFPNGDWKPKPSLMDTYSINGMNKLGAQPFFGSDRSSRNANVRLSVQ